MARRVRAIGLETRTARLKLPVAKKPVFVKVGKGLGLGYRRNATAGTWIARVSDGKGGNWTKAIGIADDYADADGKTVLDFWQAQDKARAIARDGDCHVDSGPLTIARALKDYEANLKARKGDIRNVTRVRAHLPDALGDKIVDAVTARELTAWRDRLIEKLSPATANRICTALKAALNLAADHDERITSRRAWSVGLKAIAGAEQANNVILAEEKIRKIVAKAYADSAEFGLLVEVLAVTGARINEAARLKVEDLQDAPGKPYLIMPRSHKGKGEKKIKDRPVPIRESLAEELRRIAKGKTPTAPLLTKPNGQRWEKSDQRRPFARVVKAAGLDPVTISSLRHSSIVRQILAGVPIRVVAVNHDTSVGMIERNYSSNIAPHADDLTRKGLLDLGSEIIPFPAAG
jgi:integrase